MSFSYDRYERQTRRGPASSSNRSTLGYWVPLIITVTAATAGVVAWVWNERTSGRGDSEDEEYYSEEYEESTVTGKQGRSRPPAQGAPPSFHSDPSPGEASYGTVPGQFPPTQGQFGRPPGQFGGPPGQFGGPPGSYPASRDVTGGSNETFFSQVSGAMRRTPSPQKLYEGASKRISAGMAAVGRGLSSITEEDKRDDYVDHERWSEEADSRERDTTTTTTIGAAAATAALGTAAAGSRSRDQAGIASQSRGRKRVVAMVVSAESASDFKEDSDTWNVQHTSLLSHLVGHVNSPNVQLLILIYAPHLQRHPLAGNDVTSLTPKPPPSEGESYEEINPAEADTDAEGGIISAYTSDSSPAIYNALATQASGLVAHPTHILPFTTREGHVHLLRHLGPNLVYLQESLCGDKGEVVQQIEGWVGQCVVMIGAEGAGLWDTETEDEGEKEKKAKGKWWNDERRVGLGKGVEIVEGMRLGEDWSKRVEGSG